MFVLFKKPLKLSLVACYKAFRGNRLSVCMSEPLNLCSINCLFALTLLRADDNWACLLVFPLTTTSPKVAASRVVRFKLSAGVADICAQQGLTIRGNAIKRSHFLFLIINQNRIPISKFG